MARTFRGIFWFLLVGLLSFKTMTQVWDGMIFVSDLQLRGHSGRVPAAIKKELDFSQLQGIDLFEASQKRLLSAAKVLTLHDMIGIEFGQFILRSENGDRTLACDFYDRMRIKLLATGVAKGGESPELVIETPCRSSNNLAMMEPVMLPVNKFLAETPRDMDLSYPEFNGASYQFRNLTAQWPRRWEIKEVKLYQETDDKSSVLIDAFDGREQGIQPLSIKW